MENNTDILLVLNEAKIETALDKIIKFDTDNSESEYVYGYCFWVVQASMLVKENKLIGLTYYLSIEYFDEVFEWVSKINDPHLKIKRVKDASYYDSSSFDENAYYFEVYWIIDEPDRIEGGGMDEDFWIYNKNGKNDIDRLVGIGLSYPNETAEEYDLEWCPDLI